MPIGSLNQPNSADVIVHLAGQVAVTTSVINPRDDFESNALGTFNVLEAARLSGRNPIFIYASTNKVYGGMEDVELTRGSPRAGATRIWSMAVLRHSLWISIRRMDARKARAINTCAIMRVCTVCGPWSFVNPAFMAPRQFGIEDQGWVAWFIIAAVMRRNITIYGDGKQVRDILFVDDLFNAYDLAD